MWLLIARLAVSTQCSDKTVHWLQPNLQGMVSDPGILSQANAGDAWCYPTAAASLLGKLANDGKWASAMEDGAKYATTTLDTYHQQRTTPWMDYAWHEDDALNLGHYMHTNIEGPGTTLENGRKGIVDFIKSVDPSKKAVVEIHHGRPDVSHEYPLLLHIDQNCIPTDYRTMEGPVKLSPVEGVDTTTLNGNPPTLGHTVVSYAAEAGTAEGIAIVYDVAMNVATNANPDGAYCNPTKLQLPSTQLHCIQHHTTVRIVKADSDTFPVAAIIGIAVGGVAVVGIAGYVLYTKKLALF